MARPLAGRVVFVTGGSRGIGLAIAKRVAEDGAKVVIAAKTAEPHPRLPGTIYSAAKEVEAAGGEALPVVVDVRSEESVRAAVSQAVERFGGIDVLVNNASAIQNTGTLETAMNKYDLMHQVNARGTFLTTQAALPHLLKSSNPHVLMLSPPLNMDPKWFHVAGTAYTMAKYGMSMCVLGMSEEFRGRVAFNALWPRTAIATAAIKMLAGDAGIAASRKPEIMADAAHVIFSQSARKFTGNFLIDDEVLVDMAGMPKSDLDKYSNGGAFFMPDFYLGNPDAIQRWMQVGDALKAAAKMVGLGGKRA